MLASILVEVDTQILILISSLLIPLLHGVIVKSNADDRSKVALTLALTGISGLVAAVINDGGTFTTDLLVAWGTTFVVTITTHYGLYKPLAVTGSDGVIQRLTKGQGLALAVEEDSAPA